ncbi:MAG: hypothetical protein PV344_00015 [Anaplasma sp.]|nr:hypothetical protein [Anaplasma sp.]
MRDRFVVGLLDSRLSDKLRRYPKLTLEEARLQARIHEDAVKARTAVFSEGTDSSHVVAEAKVKKVDGKIRLSSLAQERSRSRILPPLRTAGFARDEAINTPSVRRDKRNAGTASG